MKMREIKNDKELYRAVKEYTSITWQWGVSEFDDEFEPEPHELIEILNERIEWVKAYSAEVDRYLRRRRGPTWFKVLDGTQDRAR